MLGLLMAGEDAVAIDAVAARIIGFPEGFIDTTRIAAEMGLGEGKIDQLTLVGDAAGERVEGFALPSNRAHQARAAAAREARRAARVGEARDQCRRRAPAAASAPRAAP